MKEKLNLKEIFTISILKPSQYPKLLQTSISKAILSLLLICIVVGGISGISSTVLVGEGIDIAIEVLQDEDNKFEINDGILNFDKEPVTLESNQTIIYIDSSKSLSDIDSLRPILIHKDNSTAFLKDGIFVNYSGNKIEMKYSDNIMYSNLNSERAIKIFEYAQSFKYIIIIVMIAIVFIDMMLNSLILYVLGRLISKIRKVNLSNKELYKMSIFALLFPTILKVSSYIGSYSILIAGIYMSLAINSIRNNMIK